MSVSDLCTVNYTVELLEKNSVSAEGKDIFNSVLLLLFLVTYNKKK